MKLIAIDRAKTINPKNVFFHVDPVPDLHILEKIHFGALKVRYESPLLKVTLPSGEDSGTITKSVIKIIEDRYQEAFEAEQERLRTARQKRDTMLDKLSESLGIKLSDPA